MMGFFHVFPKSVIFGYITNSWMLKIFHGKSQKWMITGRFPTKRKALLGVSRFHHLKISRSVNIFLAAQAVESPWLFCYWPVTAPLAPHISSNIVD